MIKYIILATLLTACVESEPVTPFEADEPVPAKETLRIKQNNNYKTFKIYLLIHFEFRV